MRPSTPEELAARWVPGSGPVDVRLLTAGLVNRSYRVARDGALYSLRVSSAESAPGLDRRWECAVRWAAGTAGIAPPLHRCDPVEGVLVADWVGGRFWEAHEPCMPGNMDSVAQLLRRVHALEIPEPARRMDPDGWITSYATAFHLHGSELTKRARDLRHVAGKCLGTAGAVTGSTAVLCHSDLHRMNLVVGHRPILLDWEYAHVTDGFWDLAGWIANNDWTDVQAAQFLAAYMRRTAASDDLRRLRAWVWLYDYVCLLWSALYVAQASEAAGSGVLDRGRRLGARLEQSAASAGG